MRSDLRRHARMAAGGSPNAILRFLTPALMALLYALCVIGALPRASRACPICQEEGARPLTGGQGINVTWIPGDSVAACPGGDTLILADHPPTHRHPSRLRIDVWYNDNDCQPKPGIPPDSISATWTASQGNLVVNDQGAQVFADDTTNVCGHARITFPSISGCGKLAVTVWISHYNVGTKTIVVRTTDTNADGETTAGDQSGACDINYNGAADRTRAESLARSLLHRLPLHGWRRGAPVRVRRLRAAGDDRRAPRGVSPHLGWRRS